MITYSPKERREAGRELAETINNADSFLLEEIAANLNKEGFQGILAALDKHKVIEVSDSSYVDEEY